MSWHSSLKTRRYNGAERRRKFVRGMSIRCIRERVRAAKAKIALRAQGKFDGTWDGTRGVREKLGGG
jgi:hypothetical protein